MKPSDSLKLHSEQVRVLVELARLKNPRVFGSVARGEDQIGSDLDILVDAPDDISLFDLAMIEARLETELGCRVEVLTENFLAPDVRARVTSDQRPL